MKNFRLSRGKFVDGRLYPIPTIEYEKMYYGRIYLCIVWWKWFFGLTWWKDDCENNEKGNK